MMTSAYPLWAHVDGVVCKVLPDFALISEHGIGQSLIYASSHQYIDQNGTIGVPDLAKVVRPGFQASYTSEPVEHFGPGAELSLELEPEVLKYETRTVRWGSTGKKAYNTDKISGCGLFLRANANAGTGVVQDLILALHFKAMVNCERLQSDTAALSHGQYVLFDATGVDRKNEPIEWVCCRVSAHPSPSPITLDSLMISRQKLPAIVGAVFPDTNLALAWNPLISRLSDVSLSVANHSLLHKCAGAELKAVVRRESAILYHAHYGNIIMSIRAWSGNFESNLFNEMSGSNRRWNVKMLPQILNGELSWRAFFVREIHNIQPDTSPLNTCTNQVQMAQNVLPVQAAGAPVEISPLQYPSISISQSDNRPISEENDQTRTRSIPSIDYGYFDRINTANASLCSASPSVQRETQSLESNNMSPPDLDLHYNTTVTQNMGTTVTQNMGTTVTQNMGTTVTHKETQTEKSMHDRLVDVIRGDTVLLAHLIDKHPALTTDLLKTI